MPHARSAGFKQHAGDMTVKCPVFLEAAESICSDKQPKPPQLTQEACVEIRDQLNYFSHQLPCSSTFKLKNQISALRDMAAKHAAYLRKSNITINTNHSREQGDKVTDVGSYVVAPSRDSLWSTFTPGDRAAAARINQRLQGWCPDYELFRIDELLLSEEEKLHIQTLVNPDDFKSKRTKRLFPVSNLVRAGGPLIL